MLLFCKRGDLFGTQLPDKFVFKFHIGITVYLLNSLLL